MAEFDSSSQPSVQAAEETEAQMRRALGLDGRPQAYRGNERPSTAAVPTQDRFQTHRPPRRFVQDGEVPVVVIRRDHQPDNTADGAHGPSVNQLDIARNAIRTQSAARERAERALADAQTTIRDLQTKLAHERMAKDEAIRRIDTERLAAQQVLEAVQADLITERETRGRIADELRGAHEAQRKAAEVPPPLARPRGRPPKSHSRLISDVNLRTSSETPEPELEGEPVEWWVKGWQEKAARKG